MKIFGNEAPLGIWYSLEKIFSRPKMVMALFLSVPLIGLALSILGFSTAFQRSGAVLVALAIFCVYVNHFLTREIDNAQSFLQGVKHLKDLPTTISHFSRTAEDNDKAIKLAANVFAQKQRAENNFPKLLPVKDLIVKVEFLAGFCGTLIWALGDIPFTVGCVCT